MDQQFFWSRVLSFLHLSSHQHSSTPYSQSFTSFLPSQNPSSQLLPKYLDPPWRARNKVDKHSSSTSKQIDHVPTFQQPSRMLAPTHIMLNKQNNSYLEQITITMSGEWPKVTIMCWILATCCTFPFFSSRFLLGHARMLKTPPHSSTAIQYLASTMMEGEAKLLTYPPESHGEILNLKQWMHLPAHRRIREFAMHLNFVIPTRQPINCILQVKILSWLKGS